MDLNCSNTPEIPWRVQMGCEDTTSKNTESEVRAAKARQHVEKANALVNNAHTYIRACSLEIDRSHLSHSKAIGEGQFGQVFKGTYRGKKVAIKMLKPGISKEHIEYQSIIMEISALSKIGKHPNIVEFVGACVDDSENPVIVVEYGGNINLQEYLFTKYPGFNLGFVTVRKWALDILGALEHLHGLNPIIVHRDVKPANLLLTDNRNTIKLIDFGLAKVADQDPAATSMDDASGLRKRPACSCHTTNIGTPRFAAPEVFHPRRSAAAAGSAPAPAYNEKVDVYSAGLVIWYILTGLKPTCDAQKDPAARPDLEPARQRWAGLSVVLADMFHADPDARPSAADSAAAIRAAPPPYARVRAAIKRLGMLCAPTHAMLEET